jgi:hypothetical protein
MSKRKDRILNARIPAELDRELREQARRLDMPVSQLVRDVLTRTVDLLGNLTGNVEALVSNLADDVDELRRAGGPPGCVTDNPARPDDIVADVIGWQSAQAHRATTCGLDGHPIAAGEEAWLGVKMDGTTGPLIAAKTLARLREPTRAPWSRMTLARPTRCAHTGVEIPAGEHAWYQPGTSPLTIICDAAHDTYCSRGPDQED